MVTVFGFAFIANDMVQREEENVQVIPCKNGMVKLVYLKQTEESVRVSVINKNGNVIHQEDIESDKGFVNVYDLHDFGSGDFVFSINDSEGISNHEVYFKDNKNLVLCEMGNTDKYRLVMDDVEDLDVNVFNQDSQLLLSDNINSRESVNRLFDLSRIVESEDEEISFIIKHDNELLKIATF